MNIVMLTEFFMWCSILNLGLLLITGVVLIFASDFAYKMHTKFLPMPRETFNVVIYSFIGIFKLFIFVFNIIPWIALTIIG